MALRFDDALNRIAAEDPRYDADAYRFLREALDYTVQRFGKADLPAAQRHVSARELLEGLSEYALQQFGPMTCFVFERWGVRKTQDWGEIVFNMVKGGVLGKNENDRKSDFRDVYSFRERFEQPFRPTGKKRKRSHDTRDS